MTALTAGLIGAASFAVVVLVAYCCWCVSVRRRAQDSTVEAVETYRAEADDDWWRGR